MNTCRQERFGSDPGQERQTHQVKGDVPMEGRKKIRRRAFLSRSAALGLSAPVLLGAPAVFSSVGASEKMRMGILGSGGRGRRLMQKLVGEGVEIAAVCDVYEPNLKRGLTGASPKAKGHADYRSVLDRKDIDAVVIASPEHQHAPMLIDAVQAGKDAYCEKPMSYSVEEGMRMVKAVRRSDRIVQIGLQRRSSPIVHEAKKLLKECGDIYLVKAYWHWSASNPLDNSPLAGKIDWQGFVGPASSVKFEPKLYRFWRFFWDFSGGQCTEQGTHLMDVIQWFMESGTPKAATCQGAVYRMTGCETPDVFCATFEYDRFMATWTLNYNNTMDNGWNIKFLGRKGTLWLDNAGTRLYESRESGPGYTRTEKPHLVKDIRKPLSDIEHIRNFLECCRTRKEPNAPVEVGHTAVCGPHLANVALHHGTRARLNRTATRIYV